MSNKWIAERLDGLPPGVKKEILDQMDNGTLTRVYAKTSADGTTTYNTIVNSGKGTGDISDTTAEIGGIWKP